MSRLTLRSRTLLSAVTILVAGGAAALWLLTGPRPLDAGVVAALDGQGDPERGEQVFWAGGCAACHAPSGAEGDARLVLSGGQRFRTPFGTFVAPNISQHPADGIGAWGAGDLANAMMRGISPAGEHYYPAFPYTSYARMRVEDVADLYAFMKTLPAVEGDAGRNELGFPFSIRRGLGLWKLLYLDPEPAVALDNPTGPVARGQYLVEGPGHCGECHTPRDFFGGPDRSRWLAGTVAMEGTDTERRGTVANITSGEGGIGGWSQDDIATLLETGFTPDFDSVGGAMAAVVRNMAELPASDRDAIAAYLKAIPAHPDGY